MGQRKICWKTRFWDPFLHLAPPCSRKVDILMARDLKFSTFGACRKHSSSVTDFKRFCTSVLTRVTLELRVFEHKRSLPTSSRLADHTGSRTLTYNSTTRLAKQTPSHRHWQNLKNKEYNEFTKLVSLLSWNVFLGSWYCFVFQGTCFVQEEKRKAAWGLTVGVEHHRSAPGTKKVGLAKLRVWTVFFANKPPASFSSFTVLLSSNG